MSKFRNLAIVAAALCAITVPAQAEGKLGLGTEATPEQVAGWDIDVRPDGQGLPEGHGTVEQGDAIFSEKCAACHGDFAEGVDRWPVLAGGDGTLKSEHPVKTIGSYWPYLSTVYDYINRAMPFGDAQSLKPDEIYAIIAFLLNMNGIVEDDFELSKENFASVKMPNAGDFFPDPRPDGKNIKDGGPCMKDCKAKVEITMRARVLDVTPKDGDNPSGSVE